jgi:nitrite reductase (NADH) small subunit
MSSHGTVWKKAVKAEAVPANSGGTVLLDGRQIALFHFRNPDAWYACQNQCPHKLDMVLGRGLIGDEKGEPKVACPMHKKTFSLVTGKNLGGEHYCVDVFPVKIEDGYVYIGLKPLEAAA